MKQRKKVLTFDFVIELVASLTTAKFPFPSAIVCHRKNIFLN